MSDTSKPRPTVLQSLALFIPGIVIGVIGVLRSVGWITGTSEALPLGSLLALFLGALLFSVGGMMLLVAVTRPFFGTRAVDRIVEEHYERGPGARPRQQR